MARFWMFGIAGLSILFVPAAAAADLLGQSFAFTVDPAFDSQSRSQVSAVLEKTTERLSFYLEESWWNALSLTQRQENLAKLQSIAAAFNQTTYPTLRNVFGSENRPGRDGDARIAVLVHPMKEGAGGYFRNADGYLALQAPGSNEREMFYLSPDALEKPYADSVVAHEFLHLILFNQRELGKGLQDDIWLQEGLAELAPTIAGYSEPFDGSYLEKRRRDFVKDPRDSFTEWRERPADYGVASMFFHYLLDRYGQQAVVDITRSERSGIAAIDDALAKNGTGTTFAKAFEDWTVAVFLNDCSFGRAYCYERTGLNDLRIAPFTNFLPIIGDGSLRVTNLTKAWAGNWNKIGGGKGTLQFEFGGSSAVQFTAPYVVEKRDGSRQLGFLELDAAQRGSVTIEQFGSENVGFVMLPSMQRIQDSFGAAEPTHFFTWTARTIGGSAEDTSGTRLTETQIQAILNLLQSFGADGAVIANVEAALRGVPSAGPGGGPSVGFAFTRDLRTGDAGADVRELQALLNLDSETRLAAAGPGSPGSETETFGPLTKQAVIRFQEKYAADVLAPWGLERGTGYVGSTTRAKLNSLLP